MSLTGRFNFRKTLTGKIILQVEEDRKSVFRIFGKRQSHRRWRDATTLDLAAPELRALIDLRQKPQFMAQHHAAPQGTPAASAPVSDDPSAAGSPSTTSAASALPIADDPVVTTRH
jgi:hypothetical protein